MDPTLSTIGHSSIEAFESRLLSILPAKYHRNTDIDYLQTKLQRHGFVCLSNSSVHNVSATIQDLVISRQKNVVEKVFGLKIVDASNVISEKDDNIAFYNILVWC